MKNPKSHIKFLRNTLLLLVVLFSLTPCSVKESHFLVLNVEYQRPLNKTRALFSQEDSCESLVFHQVETVKTQVDFDVNLLVLAAIHPPLILADSKEGNLAKQSKKSSNLGRPLYILYSRLKLDMA